jgi:hypothetical protein
MLLRPNVELDSSDSPSQMDARLRPEVGQFAHANRGDSCPSNVSTAIFIAGGFWSSACPARSDQQLLEKGRKA